MIRRAAPLLALALLLLGAGAPAPPLREAFEGDSLRVVVEAAGASITTADRLTLTLTLTVGPGYTAPAIKVGDKLGPFTVVENRAQPPAATADKGLRVVHTLVLEPFLPGDYEIPPIEAVATPAALDPAAPAEQHKVQAISVTTAPIAIKVASVLKNAAEEADVAEIKPIADAPTNWRPILIGVAAGTLALGGLALALVAAARRRANRPPPPPAPPDETALARLRELRARDLVRQGRHREFYDEASDILRTYIERRFGLMAPERTTEEFLREAVSTGWFDQDEVRTLRRFLTSCDLVKFAEQRPTPEDSEATADLAASFIERTRPAEAAHARAPQPAASAT